MILVFDGGFMLRNFIVCLFFWKCILRWLIIIIFWIGKVIGYIVIYIFIKGWGYFCGNGIRWGYFIIFVIC